MGLKGTRSHIKVLLLGLVLVSGVISILIWLLFFKASPSTPVIGGDNQADSVRMSLSRTWQSYKERFISADGRTIDRKRNEVTTSEGQAYSLLRAVWQNDREAFDRIFSWTNRNLALRDDKLFASLWGRDAKNNWTVLDTSNNSGADEDIALALLLAARRWPEGAKQYQAVALSILNDFWARNVITIGGKPYLTAGDWATTQIQPTLNPSYSAPYAYRIFKDFDTKHNWDGLINSSFDILYGCSRLSEPVRLPPDWCTIVPADGTFRPANRELSSDYGYQAFRVYWRLALDNQWYGSQDKRSQTFLQWSGGVSNPLITASSNPAAVYRLNGEAMASGDSATYAGSLALLMTVQPPLANNLYQKMLTTYHELDGGVYNFWDEPDNYYQQNWLWFGVALYSGQLSQGIENRG